MATLGMFFVVILGTLLRAFVLYKLWGWFIVPLGVASIEMAQAYGISILVSILTMSNADIRSATEIDPAESVVYGFTISALFLVIGWITFQITLY